MGSARQVRNAEMIFEAGEHKIRGARRCYRQREVLFSAAGFCRTAGRTERDRCRSGNRPSVQRAWSHDLPVGGGIVGVGRKVPYIRNPVFSFRQSPTPYSRVFRR